MVFRWHIFGGLYFGVVVSTIAGIIFHESGHWAAYTYYGVRSHIGYTYTYCESSPLAKNNWKSAVVAASGPCLTIFATLVALIILLKNKANSGDAVNLRFVQWLLILISLFCIRNITSLLHSIILYTQG
jgi:hypothetical protein